MQGLARGFEFARVQGARGVEFGQRGLGFPEFRLRYGQCLRHLLDFDLLFRQAGRIGTRQLRLFLGEPALARVQLFELALGVAEAVFVDLPRLIQLRHHALRLAHRLLRLAQRGFLLRQRAVGGLARGGFGLHQRGLKAGLLRVHLVQRLLRGRAACLLRFHARAQILHLAIQPVAGGVLVRHGLLDACDFGLRLVIRCLCGVQRVLPGKLGLARGFQRRFDMAQACGFGFQFVLRLDQILVDARPLLRGVVLSGKPQTMLGKRQVGLQAAVVLGDFGLRGELLDLGLEFALDVLDAIHVVARVLQPGFGFLAAFLVLGHARGFFQVAAQFFRFRLDQARDHALLDDGVGARADPGAEEQVGNVAPPHPHVVDGVGGVAAAVEHALDRNLGVLRPLPGGAPELVVERQLDRGARRRLAGARAVEDHVLHGFAAQMLGRRFAEHPAHRVDDVRLAAAVRPHHAGQLRGDGNDGGVDETLEPGKFDVG